MVIIGLISGIVPLLIFIYSWLFKVPIIILPVIGILFSLGLIYLAITKGIRSCSFFLKNKKTITWFELTCCLLIAAFLIINLLGVLIPETGFDAIWYHLTIPKIYLQEGKINFIPGGLFYYSAMPKLTEIWYMISLSIDGSGSLAKAVHFSYGLGCLVLLYHITRQLTSRKYSLIAVLGMASALLFCWESQSAYVDLAWTFYLLLAIRLFFQYQKTNRFIDLITIAVTSGLAIGVKLPAVIPALYFLLLVGIKNIKHGFNFLLGVLLVASPWFIFSWLNTGNPVYPFFTGIYPHENIVDNIQLIKFLSTTWKNITWPQDPFSIFTGFITVIVIIRLIDTLKKKNKDRAMIIPRWLNVYLIINYLAWYIFFQSSGSRFLLYLLPIWLIAAVGLWYQHGQRYQKLLFFVLLFSALINLVYRSAVLTGQIPVIIGSQSSQDYLLSRLNFNFGDFYDYNGQIRQIVGNRQVLVFGFHNLFYADFTFIHESQTNDRTSYRFWLADKPISECGSCRLIYTHQPTRVYLYSF